MSSQSEDVRTGRPAVDTEHNGRVGTIFTQVERSESSGSNDGYQPTVFKQRTLCEPAFTGVEKE